MIDIQALLLNPAGGAKTRLGSGAPYPDQHDSGRARSRIDRAWTRPPARSVLPAACDLLSAVLSRQPADTLAIVQFLPLSGHGFERLLPASFAAASAATCGRTLLLDVSAPADRGTRHTLETAPADADPVTLRRTMTPDAARPGLHHAAGHPRCAAELNDLITKVSRSTAAQAAPFRMIVLDQAAPSARDHALMLSTRCTVTIPVAIAGASRLPQMLETIRRLRAAGATLAGIVLLHPPRDAESGDDTPRQIVPRC